MTFYNPDFLNNMNTHMSPVILFFCVCVSVYSMSTFPPPGFMSVCVTVCVLHVAVCEPSGCRADLAAIPSRTFDLEEFFFFSPKFFFQILSPFPLAVAKRLTRVESKIFSLVSWTPGHIKGSKAVCIKPRPSKPQILFL